MKRNSKALPPLPQRAAKMLARLKRVRGMSDDAKSVHALGLAATPEEHARQMKFHGKKIPVLKLERILKSKETIRSRRRFPTADTAPIDAEVLSDLNRLKSLFQQSQRSQAPLLQRLRTVGAGITAYSNTGLSRRSTYYYRVRAYNSGGNSNYSNQASARTL